MERVRVSGCVSPPWHQRGHADPASPQRLIFLLLHPELGLSLLEAVVGGGMTARGHAAALQCLGLCSSQSVPSEAAPSILGGPEQPADAVRSCLVGTKLSWLVLGASPWRGAVLRKMGLCFFLPQKKAGAVGPAFQLAQRCSALAAPAAGDRSLASSLSKRRWGEGG